MTNPATHAAADKSAMLRTLLATFQTVSRDAMPKLVAALATNGELALLREILARRLIEPAAWKSDKAMGMAVAPLARHAAPAALELIDGWFVAFGIDAEKDITPHLMECSSGIVAAGLVALGADALFTPNRLGNNALAQSLYDGQFDVARSLLDDCLAHDQLPVCCPESSTTAFDLLAAPSRHMGMDGGEDQARTLLNHIAAQPLTARWRAAIGHALLKAREDNCAYSSLSKEERTLLVPRRLALMSAADLDATAWIALLRAGGYGLRFSTILATEAEYAAVAATVIARFCAAGVNPDSPEAELPRLTCAGTMLQAAVLANNPLVVAALLKSGADPRRTVTDAKGQPRDAFELAKAKSETARVLSAWRAHRAMHRTIATARKPEAVAQSAARAPGRHGAKP